MNDRTIYTPLGPKRMSLIVAALEAFNPPETDGETITRFLVVRGNPVDGFEFNGPFLDNDEAITYANDNDCESWWIAKMTGPL